MPCRHRFCTPARASHWRRGHFWGGKNFANALIDVARWWFGTKLVLFNFFQITEKETGELHKGLASVCSFKHFHYYGPRNTTYKKKIVILGNFALIWDSFENIDSQNTNRVLNWAPQNWNIVPILTFQNAWKMGAPQEKCKQCNATIGNGLQIVYNNL